MGAGRNDKLSFHEKLSTINRKANTLGKRYLRNTDLDWYHLYFWVYDQKENLCAVVGIHAIPSLREVIPEKDFHAQFKSQEELNAIPDDGGETT